MRRWRSLRTALGVAAASALVALSGCRRTPKSDAVPSSSASDSPTVVRKPELRPADHLLEVGEEAPRFGGLAHNGAWVLLERLGFRPTALLFAGSSTQWVELLKTLRDGWLPLNERMSTLLAVSPADTFQHRELVSEHELPMLLLSDPEGKIQAAYGVAGEHEAVLFVVDGKGKIVRVAPNVTPSTVVVELRAALGS